MRYVVKGKPELAAPSIDERLHWVRPKEWLGEANRIGMTVNKRCDACHCVLDFDQQMPDAWLTAQGPGAHLLSGELKHFGSGKADLAVVPNNRWMKDVDHTRQRRWGVDFAISGALFQHLKSNGVKGLALDQSSTPYYTSARGEAPLEPAQRMFGGATPQAAKAKRQAATHIAAGQKAASVLKDVAWDYDGDGYIYFHLTTPQVVMLDPMTWEADESGPHRVKEFKKPGLYRMPVTAIKSAEEDGEGVAVDSATLLLIDSAFFPELQDRYDWTMACKKNGKLNTSYHQKLAEQIGTRFGVCTTPPKKFKSDFVGDGLYTLDPKQIVPVS